MRAQPRGQRLPTIVSLALELNEDQSSQLDKFLNDRRSRKGITEQRWFTLSRKLLPRIALELDPKIVRVNRNSIEVPGLSPLKLTRDCNLRGFRPRLDNLFLVYGPEGWLVVSM